MTVTDEMVERGARAMWSMVRKGAEESAMWAAIEKACAGAPWFALARACLEAVIPSAVQRAEEETAAKILQEIELWAGDLDLPECFYVWKDGKALAVPPDRFTGVCEALASKLRESRDYSLFDSLERRAKGAEARAARLDAQVAKLRKALKAVKETAISDTTSGDKLCNYCESINGHSAYCIIPVVEEALGRG